QVRWQVTETQTRMAKKCTDSEGRVYYAQVSAPVDTEIITTNDVTTSTVQLSMTETLQDIVEMADGKICQVVIDPEIGDNQNIIESGGEFTLTSQNITGGTLGLLFTEEARNGNLTKIRD
ncbi:MAG: hypothetical protein MJK18_12300, partial [Bdellovibrionales bacterium]|nr:hypothetical protein [Bdellovibrionales bacterium]